MQYYDIDSEETNILDSFEKGEWDSLTDVSSKKTLLQESAKSHLQKTKTISLRLTEKDLFDLKVYAQQEGIPYQTLAGSIIHKALHQNFLKAA